HARDVAVMLGFMHKAKVLLGSATPSLESFYNASTGQYGLVSMTERFGEAQLPEFVLIDMKEAKKMRKVKDEFSDVLLDTLRENLEKGQQSILFQNRRGYAPWRSEEHTSELQSRENLVCRLLLEKKKHY